MDHLPGLQPLLHGGGLPPGVAAIQVPTEHDVHLWVQGRDEPPDHREHFTYVNIRDSRKLSECLHFIKYTSMSCITLYNRDQYCHNHKQFHTDPPSIHLPRQYRSKVA